MPDNFPHGGLQPETLALMADLLRSTFGENARLNSYRVANRHLDYLVLIVKLGSPDIEVVIKLAGPSAPYTYAFERTAALHRIVQERTNVPVPHVLAVDTSYAKFPWRYIVKAYIQGEELAVVRPRMSGKELQDASVQLGRAVAELHSIETPGFGELSSSGDVEGGLSYIEALALRARRRIANPMHADLFIGALEANAECFEEVGRSCLCHEDLHGHNILFHQEDGAWKLSCLLDFDSAWAGHHESDLARMELWGTTIGNGFWEAYRELQGVSEAYPCRRLLHQLLWCLEYASSTPQHLADTHALCEQLSLPDVRFG